MPKNRNESEYADARLVDEPLDRTFSAMKKYLTRSILSSETPYKTTSMKSRRLRPTSAHSAEGTTTKQKKVKSKQSSNNATVSNKPAKTLVGEVSLKVLQNHPGSQITCEKVLNEMLVQVKSLLLRVHSAKMSHDPANVNIHVYKRAKEAIEEELSRIIVKLHNYQGVNPLHRVAAYSQLSTEIMTELESTVFNEDNNLIYDIKSENRLRQIESSRTHSMLTQELAVKEQTIQSLAADKVELDNSNKELTRLNESLQRELDRAIRNQAQTNQMAVEVRMQGLDYKAEVNRHCKRVIASIQSRMGFIPAGIQKEILYLQVLKAPGDPKYDDVRTSALAQYTHSASGNKIRDNERRVAKEVSASTTDWTKKVLRAERTSAFGKSVDSAEGRNKKFTQILSAVADELDEEEGYKNVESYFNRKKDSNQDWVNWAVRKDTANIDENSVSYRRTSEQASSTQHFQNSGSEGGDDSSYNNGYGYASDSQASNNRTNFPVYRDPTLAMKEDQGYSYNNYNDTDDNSDKYSNDRRDQYLADIPSDEEYEDADAERQLRYFAKQYGIASYKK